jgi:hypothetical protein
MRPRVALLAFLAALAAATLLVLDVSGGAVVLPGGTALGGLCWWHGLTGLDCPLCGMLRSLIAVAHGDLISSLRFHPAGVLMAATLVGAAVLAARGQARALRWLELGAAASIAMGLLRALVVSAG